MSDSKTPPLWLQVPEPQNLVKLYGTAVDVPAFGDRLEVDWSPGERVTSVGGLVYFATFLKETGLFDMLCGDFPINYKSNNSSSRRDIVGTAVLAILLGKTRYVHIDALPPNRWPYHPAKPPRSGVTRGLAAVSPSARLFPTTILELALELVNGRDARWPSGGRFGAVSIQNNLKSHQVGRVR